VRRDGLPLWEISARTYLSPPMDSRQPQRARKGVFIGWQAVFESCAPRCAFQRTTTSSQRRVTATGRDGLTFQNAAREMEKQGQSRDCPQEVKAQLKGLHFDTPRLSYDWTKAF
jgi:hypothetical protein